MASYRKALIQNHNRELVESYLDMYRDFDRMYGSYENYAG